MNTIKGTNFSQIFLNYILKVVFAMFLFASEKAGTIKHAFYLSINVLCVLELFKFVIPSFFTDFFLLSGNTW